MNTKMILSTVIITMLWFETGVAQQMDHSEHHHEGHSHHNYCQPISIMGAHMHSKGSVMLSYRYMPMWMKGNLQSTDDISNDDIYQNYMVAPQKMQMNMHMISVMYAPSNDITIMIMGNYISNSMDLKTKMGTDFTTKSDGFGDIVLAGLVKIVNNKKHSLHGNLGVSIPTGNIDQRDATPMMHDAQLAYPMQLGSGTWDPILGLTYSWQSETFFWGVQPKYTFRLTENSKNYTFGNRFDVVGWGAVKISDHFSFSASLSYFDKQKLEGVDADLDPMMMPLFNTANSGRSQLDFGFGASFYVPKGILKNLRVATEAKVPIYQKLNGVQMKNTLMVTLGVQYVIGKK